MNLTPSLPKPWKISKDLTRKYSVEKVGKILSPFNRVCGGSFYMMDYREQKLYLGTSTASTFCGYPRQTIEREGLAFYERILSKNEMEWLTQMNIEAHNIFFSYPEAGRQKLEFHYDLTAETIHKQTVVLHHKLVPYMMCENGNMWLGLCFISASPSLTSSYKANIVNFETGETYHFIDGKFVLCDVKSLIPDEISILECLAKDMLTKQISYKLKVSESTVNRKKQDIFDKLGVRSSIAAVHKATRMGVI